MISITNIAEDGAFASAGAALCYLLLWWKERGARDARKMQVDAMLDQARAEAGALVRDARLASSEEALKLRDDIEKSFASRRAEQSEIERRLGEREALINSQLQRVAEAERMLNEQKSSLRTGEEALRLRESEVRELSRRGAEHLQRLAGLSQAEAREAFLRRVEEEALCDASNLTRHILEDARARAEEKARRIISIAIQRYAADHTFSNTTASVAIQGDDIKGRIIGREGRNIRAFEAATGVTVLIDDTPGAVLLSGFDPVRREIARESMIRLIADGRIHPNRIEEIVGVVSREMDETIVRIGEEAVSRAALPPLAPEIVKVLGRLHFRHSYAQNILDHSVEVAHLMGLMAAELGLDVPEARRAGLLHDIGKAITHEVEGPHAITGSEMLKRHGESDAIINAVASHHNDVPPVGPLGILVSAADAISASRPGARSENMATYLKRIEELEKLAGSFPGVDRCFAVQAGRELRVFVLPDQVDDTGAFAVARGIASRIENDLQYPGQIKITVIRETRCIELAK